MHSQRLITKLTGIMLLLMLPACSTRVGTRAPFGHVMIIVMENEEFERVANAPYLQTLMRQNGTADHYSAVTHPSLPNYMALTGGHTFGFDDCEIGPDCSVDGKNTNIADSLEAAGLSWKAYMEGMPEPCVTKNMYQLKYATRHNPWVYYNDIREDHARCAAHDVPFEQLQTDINRNSLPNYVWVTPDLCHDMHDECVSGTQIQHGDEWLSIWVPKLMASKQFQADGILFITFDEGATKAGCCGASGGGRVLTLVITAARNPQARHRASSTAYNHYSLLRTIEDIFKLPHLGHANDKAITPMLDLLE